MADYTTLEDLKTYLRISGTADDELLAALISRASRIIDDHCGRWFTASEETRRYDAVGKHITGRLLLLDADLLSVTALNNGDGTAINPEEVLLRPLNMPPYFGIALKQSSGLEWTHNGDPEGAIVVTGRWGFSETPPEPVVQATLRLAAWLYRQRDTGAEGSEVPPAHLPRDVRDLLAPYVRLRWGDSLIPGLRIRSR